MGKIKKYIEMIVENENQEDMECLSDMLSDLIMDLKVDHYNKYKEYKKKLFGMAYEYQIDEEMAKEIVSNMSKGEHWTMEQTNSVMKQYGLTDISPCDFYVVMNSAYSDYNDLFNDNLDYYVKFAKDFIYDEDAIDDKVWVYYTTIPRED